MRSKIFQSMIILILITLSLVSDARTQFYQNSYALVIGINEYPSPNWSRLNYARKDAQGVAAFLTSRGFEVTQLYDTQATRTRIISEMHKIAKKVEENDRILVFFAGHGHTERFGEQDAGYIVPYDGTYDSATFISMEEIRSQSTRMGTAKHQLFIMDACYGGLLGTRAGALDPSIPHYLQAITQRDARQIITAGGKNQQVLDRGPGGHSVFTGHILKAIKDGMADINGDGYITFAELSSYVVPAASNSYQTPAPGTLPGHELGEFVFRSPKGTLKDPPEPVEPDDVTKRGSPTDARVIGRVLWGDNPVPNASIVLKDEGGSYDDNLPVLAQAVAGTDGRFSIESVQPGGYRIFVISPSEEYWEWAGTSIDIPVSQKEVSVTLRLKKKLRLLQPPNGKRVNTTTPRLRWSSLPGATRYHVDVFDDETGEAVLRQNTTDTSLVISPPLTPGVRYQWSVNAYNSAGVTIAYYSAWYFTVSK